MRDELSTRDVHNARAYVYVYVCVYIYILRESVRERESKRERERGTYCNKTFSIHRARTLR